MAKYFDYAAAAGEYTRAQATCDGEIYDLTEAFKSIRDALDMVYEEQENGNIAKNTAYS